MTDARRALLTERPRVIDTLVDAFFDDPISVWVFEDPEVRERHLPGWMAALLEMVPADGRIDVHPEIQAVAAWHAPDHGPAAAPEPEIPDELPALARVVLDALGDDEGMAKLIALAPITEGHPDEPHWYLAMLGTHRAARGLGLGSDLLAAQLTVCDEQGLPAYLESSNPRNVPLYARHGFDVTEVIHLGGDGPEVTFMYRSPRSD